MSVEEFVSLSARMLEVGGKLKTLKAERDALNKQIEELETEVRPMVSRHAALLAEALGTTLEAIPVVPTNGTGPEGGPPNAPIPGKQVEKIKARLIKYLENAEPGISALDIAEALHLDVSLVRSAMAEMARAQH